jgi:prepilin-type N-terminal cleavage/methylation domain-containing protein
MMITARSPFAGASVRRGFSLIELLLAIFILGVGIISVAAVFPAGIIQQRRTQDDVLGPVIAEAAMATIRSKVSQSDFGTFEEFGFIGAGALTNGFNAWLDSPFPNSWMDPADSQTQTGDWPWLRPAMAAVPNGQSPDAVGYAGDIDVFSARIARGSPFVPVDYSDGQWLPAWRTSEFARAGQTTPAPSCLASPSTVLASTSSASGRIRWLRSPKASDSGRRARATAVSWNARSTHGTACSGDSRGACRSRSSSTG